MKRSHTVLIAVCTFLLGFITSEVFHLVPPRQEAGTAQNTAQMQEEAPASAASLPPAPEPREEASQAYSQTPESDGSTQQPQEESAQQDSAAPAAFVGENGEAVINYSDDLVSTLYGDDALMQIVVLGDSQFGNFKGSDGLACQISQICHANVYNLAVGGSTAAVLSTEGFQEGTGWDSTSGVGIVKALNGEATLDFLSNSNYDYQRTLIQTTDFSKTDVFIVEYGINDFVGNVPLDAEGDYNVRAYRSAMRYIARELRTLYPDAKVVYCTPGYSIFYENGVQTGDSNSYKNAYGYTMLDFTNAIENVTEGLGDGVSMYNALMNCPINGTNAASDLQPDGIHMTADGRKAYVQPLARIILRAMGYTIGEGVDPSTVDWQSTKQ